MRENFNPRSREGSDSVPTRYSSGSINFNPRSREGSDLDQMYEVKRDTISIRAPARGATTKTYVAMAAQIFQSALPRGERHQFSPKSFLFS